ncbi:MAG: aspartate 1-decarboxylase [Candidatus Kappaea frigidicola]|nr:aspartate 1-decarboxylase [Candidatus Kappaea frigidicola]
MFKKFCMAKIHRATIKKKDIEYKGSIGIDKALLGKSGILPDEMVLVLNYNNGVRFETYVIEEEEGSGLIALYGPAAKLGEIGDEVIIISSAYLTPEEAQKHTIKVLKVDNKNQVVD